MSDLGEMVYGKMSHEAFQLQLFMSPLRLINRHKKIKETMRGVMGVNQAF